MLSTRVILPVLQRKFGVKENSERKKEKGEENEREAKGKGKGERRGRER